jgi:hypothetical protein
LEFITCANNGLLLCSTGLAASFALRVKAKKPSKRAGKMCSFLMDVNITLKN